MATGKRPHKHGILGFVRKEDKRMYKSTDRKTHAIWNIVSDAGMTVGLVNWWNSYPPEIINGIVVTDYALPKQAEKRRKFYRATEETDSAPVIFPREWMPEASRVIESEETLTSVSNPFAANESFPKWVRTDSLKQTFREDELVTRLALTVEDTLDPDLLMVFLLGIDRVSHWLWGAMEPTDVYPERLRLAGLERDASLAALLNYYRFTDALIGRLLERYEPEDLVIVVSDHGFEGGTKLTSGTGTHDTEAAQDGVFFIRGSHVPVVPGKWDAQPPLSVTDVTPTLLAWLGLPLAEDMDGRPASFLEVDPSPAIPTYDTKPIERLEGEEVDAEAEMIERLRELGYIE